jgi:hypothetical protein
MDYPQHMRPYVEEQMRPVRDVRITQPFKIEHRGYSIRREPLRTPIIINNFNRLTYLRALVDGLRERGYENLYVIDNNSDYEPLLTYYEEADLRVFALDQNVGYLALWRTPIFKEFINSHYVYTDSDIVPSQDCPADIVSHLKEVLDQHPSVKKAGLGLKIDDLPACYALRDKVVAHEGQFWHTPLGPGVFHAAVDTTFALYRPKVMGGWWLPAARTGEPYVARHLPWYSDSKNLTAEESNYLRTSSSSTHWTEAEAGLGESAPSGQSLGEFFDHVYCINLARRPDRWADAQAQFEALGLEVERFNAVDGSTLEGLPDTVHLAQSAQAIPGVVGCSLSHQAVISDAHEKGYDRILIVEDDVVFSDDAPRQFSEAVNQVPPDWAMLYLGGNHVRGVTSIAPNVARMHGSYTTNCYALSRQMIEFLANTLPTQPSGVTTPIDVYFAALHSQAPCYVFRPHLAWQRDGYSDVECADVDYGFLRD